MLFSSTYHARGCDVVIRNTCSKCSTSEARGDHRAEGKGGGLAGIAETKCRALYRFRKKGGPIKVGALLENRGQFSNIPQGSMGGGLHTGGGDLLACLFEMRPGVAVEISERIARHIAEDMPSPCRTRAKQEQECGHVKLRQRSMLCHEHQLEAEQNEACRWALEIVQC